MTTAATGDLPRDPDSASPAVELDDDGRLLAEMPCHGCGYRLRGLRMSDVCPECTMSVRRSIGGDELAHADPRWLALLARGCHCYVIGAVSTLALLAALTVVSGVLASVGGPAASVVDEVQIAGGLVSAVTAALTVVGAWLLTTPDPAAREGSGLSMRTLVRVGLIAHVLSTPTQLYWSGSTMTVMVLGVGAGLLAIAGWTLYFLYLRRLVGRLPSPSLAAQLRLIAIGFALFACLMSLGGLTTAWLGPRAGTAGGLFVAVALTTCFSLTIYFLIEVWAIVVHLVFARRLRACLAPAPG